MNDEEFECRMKEMKSEFPDMFSHPGVQADEVWIGDFLIESAGILRASYQRAGLKSARCGGEPVLRKTNDGQNEAFFKPIFANLREFLEVDEAHRLAKR